MKSIKKELNSSMKNAGEFVLKNMYADLIKPGTQKQLECIWNLLHNFKELYMNKIHNAVKSGRLQGDDRFHIWSDYYKLTNHLDSFMWTLTVIHNLDLDNSNQNKLYLRCWLNELYEVE